MIHHYYLTSVAESDVQHIWDYISANSIAAADHMIDRFTDLLISSPQTLKPAKSYRIEREPFNEQRFRPLSSTTNSLAVK